MRKKILLTLLLIVIIFSFCFLWNLKDDIFDNSTDTQHAHEFGEWITRNPTCFEQGYKKRACGCGEVEKEDIALVDHVFDESYLSDGEHHWHQCRYCGLIKEKEEHEMVDGKCDVCKYDTSCLHYFERGFNELQHWTYCRTCSYLYKEFEDHELDDWGYCGICGRDVCEHSWCEDYTYDDYFHYTYCIRCEKPKKAMHFVKEELGNCSVCEYREIPSPKIEYALSADGSYAIITGYSGNDIKLIIDNVYNGVPVTHIGEGAFRNADSVKTVVMPKSITHIGAYAFADCDGFERIITTINLQFIGEGAFEGCDNLEHFLLGAGIVDIEKNVFLDCHKLDNIYLEASMMDFEDRNIAREGNGRLFASIFYIETSYMGFGSNPGYYYWFENITDQIQVTTTHIGGISSTYDEYTAMEDGKRLSVEAFVVSVGELYVDNDGKDRIDLTLWNETGTFVINGVSASKQGTKKLEIGQKILVFGKKSTVDGEACIEGDYFYFCEGGRMYYPYEK